MIPYSPMEIPPGDGRTRAQMEGPMNAMSYSGIRKYYVYILTNKHKTVLYTGMTNNLIRRLHEHQHQEPGAKTFTGRYNCFYLLYYERYNDVNQTISREKEIKGWIRRKKEDLINSLNPDWEFLKVE